MQSKFTKESWGEKEIFLQCLESIKSFENAKEVTFEQMRLLERNFEIIGGLLNEWTGKGLLDAKHDITVKRAIATRHKISHFYTGFDLQVAKAAIKDFDHLIEITKHIKD